jgi:hypothetical protein
MDQLRGGIQNLADARIAFDVSHPVDVAYRPTVCAGSSRAAPSSPADDEPDFLTVPRRPLGLRASDISSPFHPGCSKTSLPPM